MNAFVRNLKSLLVLCAIAIFCIGCKSAPTLDDSPWEVITLPAAVTLSDIAFADDTQHGWVVGSQATLYGTSDGGNTWNEQPVDLGDEKITFMAVSFHGDEGWVVGKPSVLLHTDDAGQTWSRIPLSAKLPGAPYGITALGPQSAEMVTDLGAIYQTDNGGRTWKALVEAAIGEARNISRSPDGKYVAVSLRGNFYSTWEPGQIEWTPHQRNSSRRLQNMGYSPDEGLWLLANGGLVQFSVPGTLEDWQDLQDPDTSTTMGLLDLAYRQPNEIWLAGGGGNLLRSNDHGATWQKDALVDNVPSNLYKVVFLSPEQGFILGQNGILLKYTPSTESA